jgi:methionine sulfoxide reductase heme-binding subunit
MNKIRTTSIFLGIFSVVVVSVFFNTSTFAQDVGQNGSAVVDEKSTIVVENLPQSSLAHALFERVKTSWPWYVTRASGLVAGFLLVLLMLSGTGFITGSTFRFLEPITAWATHRALGIALGVSVTIHVVVLYFDEFVDFDVVSLLIPFVSDVRPVELFGVSFGSLYVALGILALYVFFIVIITSLLWVEKKPYTWKIIHFLSYLGMFFVFIHGLYLGTDLAQGVLRYVWIGAGILVALATLQRLWRAKTV